MNDLTPAEDLCAQHLFRAGRTPRSDEYIAGVMAALRYRTGEHETMQQCPYRLGTAQADAWFAGVDEGHAIWRWHQQEEERWASGNA